jgi:hypothetical protein
MVWIGGECLMRGDPSLLQQLRSVIQTFKNSER